MKHNARSIRPFIGAKDYDLSRSFYRDFGFEEFIIDANMSLFKTSDFGFYLQNYYAKDWIDNTMVFLEVSDVEQFWIDLSGSGLTTKYESVRFGAIKQYDWGKECFVHDPSGILWHIGEFNINK
jgi:catechol 2,3-dioxygenase-like lactoylglutathione lyase family enzyme